MEFKSLFEYVGDEAENRFNYIIVCDKTDDRTLRNILMGEFNKWKMEETVNDARTLTITDTTRGSLGGA
eukprot:5929508-Lingulodinium_polyedra.AAC.1